MLSPSWLRCVAHAGCRPVRFSPSRLSPVWFVAQTTVHPWSDWYMAPSAGCSTSAIYDSRDGCSDVGSWHGGCLDLSAVHGHASTRCAVTSSTGAAPPPLTTPCEDAAAERRSWSRSRSLIRCRLSGRLFLERNQSDTHNSAQFRGANRRSRSAALTHGRQGGTPFCLERHQLFR